MLGTIDLAFFLLQHFSVFASHRLCEYCIQPPNSLNSMFLEFFPGYFLVLTLFAIQFHMFLCYSFVVQAFIWFSLACFPLAAFFFSSTLNKTKTATTLSSPLPTILCVARNLCFSCYMNESHNLFLSYLSGLNNNKTQQREIMVNFHLLSIFHNFRL